MERMKDERISMIDILIATHLRLARQGPGSTEMTTKALSFLDNPDQVSRTLDLGCGTGSQTILLAQSIGGSVIGVDLIPEFIDVLNSNAHKMNLQQRVQGIVGSMEDLPFQSEEFDLIWSEGAIDSIGFENELDYWNRFLKRGGYVAVTCPSWFTRDHPAEVEKFWVDAGSAMDSIEHNISIMQRTGYSFVASFALPEICWMDNYFIPRESAEKAFFTMHRGDENVKAYIRDAQYEMELYSKYKQYYGYAFYVGKKI